MGGEPIDAAEAKSRRLHAAFERYVSKRDADRLLELEEIPVLASHPAAPEFDPDDMDGA